MFPSLFSPDLMQAWSRLGTQMLRAQADCLGASVLCSAGRAPAGPAAPDDALRQAREPGRLALDAASRAPELFSRLADEWLRFHPAREVYGPVVDGAQLATRAWIYWAQTCAERRVDLRPW